MNATAFDTAAYWADKPHKKWVTLFVWKDEKRKERSRSVYTQARTLERATDCARRNTLVPPKASAYTRLATPQDLGCTLVGSHGA